MAEHTQSRKRRFTDMFPDQVRDIMYKMVDYVKLLQTSNVARPSTEDDSPLLIQIQEGWPVVPTATDLNTLGKLKLEDILRQYLTAQYSMFLFKLKDCRT